MWDKPEVMLLTANLLYGLCAIIMVYLVLFTIVHLPIFPLRHVKVVGDLRQVTPQQLDNIAKQKLHGNFFTVDLNQARAAFEKLPWVRQVHVRRQWPDTLEVNLEEHVAFARWENSGLVNTFGELFAAASDNNLPILHGPADSVKELTSAYLTFRQILLPIKQAPSQIVISPRRAWRLTLSNGTVVELGRERMIERLTRFVSFYERTISPLQRPIRYVDLRYANGFAARIDGLRWDDKLLKGKQQKRAEVN